MTYLFLKSFHILAVILWIGSLCLTSFVTASTKMNADQMRSAMRISEASIGATWVLGIALVIMGSWYASPWWYFLLALTLVIVILVVLKRPY